MTNLPPFLQRKGFTGFIQNRGQFITEGLFHETRTEFPPAYTFQRVDIEDPKEPGRVIHSFPREYLALLDPTGYKASQELLGGWEHWLRLMRNKMLREYIDELNAEIFASLKSIGYETYVKAAKDGDLKAAEWLIKQSVPEVPSRPVGRPNKPPQPKPDESAAIEADLARIKGG